MKPTGTLKDILKPPFKRYGREIPFDGGIIDFHYPEYYQSSPSVESMEKCNLIMDFVVAALNEKWERDFGDYEGFDYEKEKRKFVKELKDGKFDNRPDENFITINIPLIHKHHCCNDCKKLKGEICIFWKKSADEVALKCEPKAEWEKNEDDN